MNKQKAFQKITYSPIGIFHTSFSAEKMPPRQGRFLPESKGEIEILPQYHSALNELDGFEYIIVLFSFSEVKDWKPMVNPPGSNPNRNYGLFATRTPRRPNPIGLTIVKLEEIKNGVLYVSGVDAFTGTPVLDIKPYLPAVDCVRSAQNESVEKDLWKYDQ
jgi:tRNA (adenine37-N6)-methyltransferase